MTLEVRRSAARFTTEAEGRTTRHSFSFDRHYDPTNVGHALLVAHNDDLLGPGHGYGPHPHVDTEIVTWVLEGSLVHEDTEGHAGVVRPGLVQAMSAGTGVVHSERAEGPADRTADAPADRTAGQTGTGSGSARPGPTRFVQMWLRPDEPGRRPSYDQADVATALAPGDLVPVASGREDAPVRVHADATLHAARPAAGRVLRLPDAPYLHVFVARGSVDLEGAGRLDPADAVRLAGEGGQALTALTDAEVLVWAMHAR